MSLKPFCQITADITCKLSGLLRIKSMIFLPSGNAPTLEIREFELYINLNIALYCLKIVKFLIDKIINFHLV